MKACKAVLTMLVLSGTVYAYAGDVKIVVNSGVKANAISEGDLRKIFLEENTSLTDGTHVEPVLEKDGPTHQAFVQRYLNSTDADLQMYYHTLVFSGRGFMPKTLPSDAAVVDYVAKTKGAIGYVSSETSTLGVKILDTVPETNRGERKLLSRIEPEYPETLRQLHIGGIVRLSVQISAKGNVETVQLLGGNPILGESAIAAVKQWIYAPSRSRTTVEVKIPFDPDR